MMLTEVTAKTKWCPFARVQSEFSGGINRSSRKSLRRGSKFNATRCIGSECMVWRWQDGSHFDSKRGFQVMDMGQHGVGHARGYCGLAALKNEVAKLERAL